MIRLRRKWKRVTHLIAPNGTAMVHDGRQWTITVQLLASGAWAYDVRRKTLGGHAYLVGKGTASTELDAQALAESIARDTKAEKIALEKMGDDWRRERS